MAAPPPPPPSQTFPYDYLFKVLIIGDASVGKVSRWSPLWCGLRFCGLLYTLNCRLRSSWSMFVTHGICWFLKLFLCLCATQTVFDVAPLYGRQF